MEAGHLESLGRHSGLVPDYEPLWRKAARTLVVYLASLVCLLVLDAIWMKLIAPPLGVDYFQVVRVRTPLCPSGVNVLTICAA